jgi:hypothetical protein
MVASVCGHGGGGVKGGGPTSPVCGHLPLAHSHWPAPFTTAPFWRARLAPRCPLWAAGSAGGGVAIVGVDTTQIPGDCNSSYWPYNFSVLATVSNALISNNTAHAAPGSRYDLPSGGGLYFDCGGLLTLTRSTLTNNSAGQFGGGLSLGSSGAVEACGGSLDRTLIQGNTADRGGAQVHMACAAGLAVANSTLQLGVTASEVGGVWGAAGGG